MVVESGDGRTWPVHKLVLGARSEVFKGMFAHPMRENEEGRVVIVDADGETVHGFLRHLYDGNPPAGSVDSRMWVGLTNLATKYGVASLVDMCTETLLSDLDVANAAERLCLADTLGIPRLRGGVLDFILGSPGRLWEVQGTEAFDYLGADMLQDVVCELAAQNAGRRPREAGGFELEDGTDWQGVSLAHLRRACRERGLPTAGDSQALRASLAG